VLDDEAVDGGLQFDEGAEDAVLQASPGQLCEEALDGVQPGTRRRREMEGPARVSVELGADLRVLVGGVVVQDHVHDLACRNIALDGVDKTDELVMPMALHVPPNDLVDHDVQRREQRGRAVALIVVVAPRRFLSSKLG
jgi:hypothetical protein